eukprot:scaffold13738_cov148-Skeletonema_menzelii.AAC.2
MKQKRPNLLRTAANQRWVRIRLKSKPSGEEPQNNVSTTSANQAAINSPTKSSRTSLEILSATFQISIKVEALSFFPFGENKKR